MKRKKNLSRLLVTELYCCVPVWSGCRLLALYAHLNGLDRLLGLCIWWVEYIDKYYIYIYSTTLWLNIILITLVFRQLDVKINKKLMSRLLGTAWLCPGLVWLPATRPSCPCTWAGPTALPTCGARNSWSGAPPSSSDTTQDRKYVFGFNT